MDRPTSSSKSREERATGLGALVDARFNRSIAVSGAFFEAEAERIAHCCWAMAKRFHKGGRLLAFGTGSAATDAQHVAVEFVHPVIVGKRALPAMALTNDSATLSGMTAGQTTVSPFAHQLRVLARPQDIAIGFSSGCGDGSVLEGLLEARRMGLLTLALMGGTAQSGNPSVDSGGALDFYFVVPSDDPLAVQETHETLYHVLWELVHIFFENEGLLE